MNGDQTVHLSLEGKIVGPWVAELRRVVEESRALSGRVALDLSGVGFVSTEGLGLLRELETGKVELRNAGDYVAQLVDAGRAEADLLRRLQAAEECAWETVVRETTGRLLAVARRLLRNDDEARDAVQSSFAAAFRSIRSFQGGSHVATWLHRIVVNEALMKIRSRGRRHEVPIDDLLPRFDDTQHRVREIEGTIPSVDETSLDPLLRDQVRGCIEELPTSYRVVVLLRDIEELDTKEVAEILSLTENAVKVRLHRARQALRTLIVRRLERNAPPARVAGARVRPHAS